MLLPSYVDHIIQNKNYTWRAKTNHEIKANIVDIEINHMEHDHIKYSVWYKIIDNPHRIGKFETSMANWASQMEVCEKEEILEEWEDF